MPSTLPPRARRRPLALLLVLSALLGGGASTTILASTGALTRDSTTVIQRASATTTASSGLDAETLYASTSAGVVDIAAGDATGTGFEVDKRGDIVTAAHVVDGASSVTVKLQDGTTRKATVMGSDDATDVAVIRIDASGLTLHPLRLGSSSSLKVGQQIAAIGDPFGYERSLSTGIVSGVDRTIQAPNGFTVAHAIQTDAAINPGNSGGPILDADGAVVGIADQIATGASGADQSSGVGFAVPIDLVKRQLGTLESGGKVEHAYIGIATADASAPGARVASVSNGGPAASAGLKTGDVITRLGDSPVTDSTSLVAAIAAHQPGDKVAVTVTRGSQTLHLTVTLGAQPAQSASPASRR
jgi:putative serine protease PepD